MAWLLLVLAGLLEIAWAYALKRSDGLSDPAWTAAFLVALAGSMALLAKAVRTLPLGTAYAVWVGIGAAGTAILGIVLLGESASPARLGFLALLLVGIAGLKFTA